MSEKQLRDELPLHEVDDKTVRKIIRKATDKKQQNRYQSAAQLRVDIDKWLNETPRPRYPMNKVALLASAIVAIGAIAYLAITYKPAQNLIVVLEEENDTLKVYPEPQPDQEAEPIIEPSVEQAVSLLADAAMAKDGLDMLTSLAEWGNYEATFLLSRLYFDPEAAYGKVEFYDPNWATQRRNSGLVADNARAHQLLFDAYRMEAGKNDYRMLYELGCDFLYAQGVAKKFGEAKWCFEQVKELSTNDSRYQTASEEKRKQIQETSKKP